MTNHYQNGVARAQQEIANRMCGRVENASSGNMQMTRKDFDTHLRTISGEARPSGKNTPDGKYGWFDVFDRDGYKIEKVWVY